MFIWKYTEVSSFKCTITALFVFLISVLQAQNIRISGIIKDAQNGETLIGANIFSTDRIDGTISNEYGYYSLTIERDTVTVVYSYIGYQPISIFLTAPIDTIIQIELSEGNQLKEVVVSASSNIERVNSTQMGVDEVTVKEAKEIAAIFGEVDIIKVLQLKPGVQSGTEGSSGLYVRGGGADQNNFILDEAPVYNPSHLFGFFSTFNADALKNVKLFKAGFPSRYGGKLSSVIDIKMREGNRKRFAMSGGLGLISSRLTIEGPIVKDKGAFLISGRRTYVDIFTSLANEINANNEDWNQIPAYSFHDLNVKFNYDISDKDRIFLSGYYGRDVFLFDGANFDFNFEWGNITSTLRWNRILHSNLYMNTSFTFSDFEYIIKNQFDEFNLEIGSGIRDVNLKSDFSWNLNSDHDVVFGWNAIYHRFSIGRFNASNNNDIDFEAGTVYDAGEFGIYISDEWDISPKVRLLSGIRLSGFYNDNTFYWGAEPRLALRYKASSVVSLKASYTRMYQYLHLISTSGATLPTDVWYPSNSRIRPQSSDQVSAGTSIAIGKDYFISFETYYKWMYDQIDFRDGAQLFLNDNLDDEFIFGKGYSYGGELYLEKKNGWIRGWIGYTLSWTWREFDAVNGGRPYHPRYDRRHDISAVLMIDIPWNLPKFPLTFSTSWVYGTGNATSLPTSRYFSSDFVGTNAIELVPVYTERGSFRLPAYHRLDISLVWKLFPLKANRFKSDLTFSVYNVYNRRNPFFMYIDAVYADGNSANQVPEKLEAKVVSLFPVIPSITWNFKW